MQWIITEFLKVKSRSELWKNLYQTLMVEFAEQSLQAE